MAIKKRTVKIPIYYCKLVIQIHDIIDKPEYAAYCTFNDDSVILNITEDIPLEVIAHEAVHITNYVYRECNMEVDINNDEPYAYLLAWIVQQILAAIKKNTE